MKDLSNGKEWKLILQFALPMLLGGVFQQLYNIVDSIIVGNVLGKEALAAVGASFPVIFTLIALVIGIGSGASVVISQYFGAKKIEEVKRTIDTINIILLVASIVISIPGAYFSENIFRLLMLPEEVLPLATPYLQVYLGGMIVFFGFNGISSILRGLGDSKTPLYFLILASIMNILLDLLFIYYLKLDIQWAAVATVIAQGGAFITAIIYLNKTHEIIRISLIKLQFNNKIFKQILNIGLPSGIQHSFVALGMMAVLGIVNTFGTDVIAGYTVANRLDSLAILPAMNFSAALVTFVGQNLGAGKMHRVKKGLHATLAMSSVVSIAITGVIYLWGNQLMGLFTDAQEVIDVGNEYLVVVSSFYLLFSAMFCYGSVLRGAGATMFQMFVTLFTLWVIRVPLAYILSQHIGESGIWWSMPIAWFIGLCILYFYYLSGKWMKSVIIRPDTDISQP